MKLFAWRDPQEAFPPDALRVHAPDAARCSCAPQPWTARPPTGCSTSTAADAARGARRSPSGAHARAGSAARARAATCSSRRTRGCSAAGTSRIYGGPPGEPVTADRLRVARGRRPQIADAFLPVAAALVALALRVLLLRSLLRRPAGQKALWAAGFALFAVAAASEALAQRSGWSPALFRAYYLAGGVLTVAYLGAGSAWLLLPRRGRDLLLGGARGRDGRRGTAVLLAPVDVRRARGDAAVGRPPANDVLGGHAFLWAVALNSLGTIFLVGGSLLLDRPAAARAGERLDRSGRARPSPSPPGCRERATTRSSTSAS